MKNVFGKFENTAEFSHPKMNYSALPHVEPHSGALFGLKVKKIFHNNVSWENFGKINKKGGSVALWESLPLWESVSFWKSVPLFESVFVLFFLTEAKIYKIILFKSKKITMNLEVKCVNYGQK